jgi:glycosyltransferase involved in cell wall biosynthesis
MNDGIIYDIAEFMNCPLRTGIQRVTYELLCRWPAGRVPLVPALSTPQGRMYRLPPETLGLITEFFGRSPGDPARARQCLTDIAAAAATLPELAPERCLALFNPELFFNHWRPRYYSELLGRMGDQIFFMLYDFFPWLYPWWFDRGLMHQIPLMEYFRLVRQVEHAAFISEATRQDYLRRILRRERPAGPVLALGGDGLGVAEPDFNPQRRRFTVVGSLEPRRNVGPVLQAFAALWADGVDVRLTLLGRLIALPDSDRRLFDEFVARQPQFEWKSCPTDSELREIIRDSRATLCVSRAEGFGIPPLESLSLGVPVIGYAGVPSLAAIEPHGQIRLTLPDADSIRQAVLRFLDDDFARQQYRDLTRLEIPTWAGLARKASDWIENTGAGSVAGREAKQIWPLGPGDAIPPRRAA